MRHLNGVQRDGADPEPGVQAVEVGDAAIVVVLERAVDAEGAEYSRDGVEDQMRQLGCVVVQFWKHLVDHNGCHREKPTLMLNADMPEMELKVSMIIRLCIAVTFTAEDNVANQHKNRVNLQ